jgi:hypothetical protein
LTYNLTITCNYYVINEDILICLIFINVMRYWDKTLVHVVHSTLCWYPAGHTPKLTHCVTRIYIIMAEPRHLELKSFRSGQMLFRDLLVINATRDCFLWKSHTSRRVCVGRWVVIVYWQSTRVYMAPWIELDRYGMLTKHTRIYGTVDCAGSL